MFKFVVLFAFIAVAAARPWSSGSTPLVYSSPIVQEHGYAKIGTVVKSVPTGISHQSSTVVHNSAEYVEPIVAKVVKTYAAAPAIKTYAVPAPLSLEYTLKAYTGNTINKAPVQTYAAPLVVSASVPYSYSAPAPLSLPAPLSYASGWQ